MIPRRTTSIRQHTFSLYNLSSNEIYFEDYIVHYESRTRPDVEPNQIKGRLKICSRSIVFVPSEIRTPMIKILYKDINRFEDSRKKELSLVNSTIVSPTSPNRSGSNSLILTCSSVILMHPNGRIEPYTIDYNTQQIHFEFAHTSVEDCISVVGQLYRSTKLSYPDQIMMIDSIVQGRLKNLKFDIQQLRVLSTKILFENEAYMIKPLIKNPGRCLIIDQYCYFQALNNIDEQQITTHDLNCLEKITKRRYKFRYIGCELQFQIIEKQRRRKQSLYLVFENEDICSTFYNLIVNQSSVQQNHTSFENMTLRWQQGDISNYDYLLYLNDRGERSFQDFSQYPVFPWVLRNYHSDKLDLKDPQSFRDLSKPIGALSIDRLERLKERFNNMSLPSNHQRFLYGSFYSNPGFVVYFLARLYPEMSLCLNGGRFDHPDRLFHSMIDTWKSVLTSDSDVKELLPEFYMSSQFNNNADGETDEEKDRQDGKFLLNQFNTDFGVRHDNVRVGDVLLPPWAENEKDFVYKMRLALESDHVSDHLHEWIDLIFGYKQRGEAAHQADNLFHYLRYGVPEQTASKSVDSFDEQLSLETEILEFGQVPKQLFDKPHPKKLKADQRGQKPLETTAEPIERKKSIVQSNNESEQISTTPPQSSSPAVSQLDEFELGQFERDSFCRLHKNAITGILPHPSFPSTQLLTIGDDGFLRNYLVDRTKVETFFPISSRALTCFQAISVRESLRTTNRSSLAFIGSRDNTLYAFKIETGTSLFSQVLHDDHITDLYITNRSLPVLLLTASADTTVRYWSLENVLTMDDETYLFQPNYHLSNVLRMHHEISFDAPCTSISVLEQHGLLAVGGQDGSISLCDFGAGQIVRQISKNSPILALSLRSDGLFLAYLSSKIFTLVDILTDTDVFSTPCSSDDQSFTSLFYSMRTLILGLSNGSCDIWNLKTCEKVNHLNICDKLAITKISHNDGMFFFGTDDGSVHSYIYTNRQSN